MSEQVLYRKYRPRAFEEVVGQRHVTGAIQNAIATGRVAHAYLFSGPRGIGKTTVARLIAKALNCQSKKDRPCNECIMCRDFNEGRVLDVVEIDAASNRGIDEIRELREGVRFVPVRGQFKTYIIDEVHQLTKEAFNALLKTLEEPPSHAVFILATTELEKVPATIVSRTQHYDFHRPTVGEISARLLDIAAREGTKLDEDAAGLMALAAEGGMRDGESILGQIMAVEDEKITRKEVEDVLGLPRREAIKAIFEHIAKKDAFAALSLIQAMHDSGYDLAYASKLLATYFRSAMLLKTDPALKRFAASGLLPDEYECIAAHLPLFTREYLAGGMNVILRNMNSFKKNPIPQLPLELTVLELMEEGKENI